MSDTQVPATAAPVDNNNINVVNPSGELVQIPAAQADDAFSSGYMQASPEDVHDYVVQQKYGGVGQQALAGIEGAASAGTFGLSTGLERAMGVSPEDIAGRREANPITHAAGQVAGLIAPAIVTGGTSAGAAGVMEGAGAATSGALGLGAEGAGLVSKIGSGAVRMATENAMFEAGDEVSKSFSGNPPQSVEQAITDIGLAALVGGAFGTVSPVWSATLGPKLTKTLGDITSKVGGVEGMAIDDIAQNAAKIGVNLTPEQTAMISNNPAAREAFQVLMHSDTKAGTAAKEHLANFQSTMADEMVRAVGRDPETIANNAVSEYKAGNDVKKAILDKYTPEYERIGKDFNAVRETASSIPVSMESKALMSEQVGNLVAKEELGLRPGEIAKKEADMLQAAIPNMKTVDSMMKYQTQLNEAIRANPDLKRIGGQLRNIIRDEEGKLLDSHIFEKFGKDAVKRDQLLNARLEYSKLASSMDELADKLATRQHYGPADFLKAVKEAQPEKLLKSIAKPEDVELQQLLHSQYPELSNISKNYHIDSLLEKAVDRAKSGMNVDPKIISKAFSKSNMTPELRAYLLSPEAAQKLDIIGQMINSVPKDINSSGTAQTLTKLMNKVPESAAGMIGLLMGHSGPGTLAAIAAAHVGKHLATELPATTKLALLKYIGSKGELSSTGFKTMFDFINHNSEGIKTTNKLVSSIFKAGVSAATTTAILPPQKELDKLDKHLTAIQANPALLQSVGGNVAHYLPDHAAHMGQMAANAVNTLNSMRPVNPQVSPLDAKQPLTPTQKADWNRTLQVAQQPLSAVARISEGTLTQKDVQTMQQLYPSLYQSVAEKLNDQIATAAQKEIQIPYKTRMGLSLFLNHPLDTTLTGASIMAAQPQEPQQAPKQAQKTPSAASMRGLEKGLAGNYTATQARELSRKH